MSNHLPETQDDSADISLLGQQLRELREAQGLSYDDIAKHTHVRPHVLKAIEDGRIDEIAAPVYTRGFIKTYCEYLMASDLWKKYSTALPLPESPKYIKKGTLGNPYDITPPTPMFRRSSIVWVYMILVVAVFGAAFLLWSQHNDPDKGGNGFFLRSPDERRAPDVSEPTVSPTLPALSADAPIVSVDAGRAVETPPPALPPSPQEGPVVVSGEPQLEVPPITPPPVDLSWLDGVVSASQRGSALTDPRPEIPDNRLLIEINAPTRLVVQQNGSVVTRRSMVRGGVRSYDVTMDTPVSLSVGNAANITWFGKTYHPVGNDNKPLALTFYPDGRVRVTSGSASGF